ncbi:MAG: VanW family protein [Clostridia bacterium]|nr:VanW family protein [Clostridia bacterium]
MKKIALYLLILLAAASLCGCAKKYTDMEDAQNSGATLGECIFIDNVNVSGMTPVQAVSAVEQAHTQMLKGLYYTITAEEDSLDINAALLPITFDTRDTVMEALSLKKHWPEGIEPRKLYTSMGADIDELRKALEELSSELQYDATDAKATYSPENGFTYTDHADGRALDYEHLCSGVHELITSGKGGSVSAVTSAVPAKYTSDMARQDTTLVSEFTTSFSGSTYGKANRVFNIVKAASLIDGKTIAPGEEFDTNAILGPRNEESGWKTAAGIRDGTYVQEYGGGVCQVSTTLYNAALMADLDITERHHHSWPLGYVDIGRDATISTGGPNLRFVNSGPAPITISAITDKGNKTVTVRIYGRPLKDGMRIELTSKKTATLSSPGTETVYDPSLAPGESKTVRKARRGSVAETHKLYYSANGELIDKVLVTEDKYRSISGIVNVGPRPETPSSVQ